MRSRVGRVAVRLRVPDGDRARAESAARTIEQVVIRQAVEELERAIHERYGRDTIVRVRRIAARWRLDYEVIGDAATALECGRDLADAIVADIEATPPPQRLRPEPDAEVAVFSDEPHAVAAYLADRADDREAWFHAPRESVLAEWSAAVAVGPRNVEAVARWLERMDRRVEVARMIERATATLTGMLATPSERPVSRPVTAAPRDAAVRGPMASETRVAEIAVASALRPTLASEPAIIETRAAHDAVALDAPDLPMRVPTRVAGLWYLARLVMQTGLAEQLWAAGVLEGDFLAHVACAVAGPGLVDDPCWRWFGGARDHEPRLDPLPEWAADELAAGRAASLARLAPGVEVLAPLPCLAPAEPRVRDAVSRSAAALCTLFCVRLGVAPDVELVRGYLRFAGILEAGDPLRVIAPMESIDVDLRRAGLDLDPGFLPWLDRKVVIVFDDDLRP